MPNELTDQLTEQSYADPTQPLATQDRDLSAQTTALPAYLQNEGQDGDLAEMSKFTRPPMLKVVQSQSDAALVEQFGVGSVIMLPSKTLVMKKDGEFFFTPLLFKPSWMTWNPYALRGTLPNIAAFTENYNDPLAKKARNQAEWEEEVMIDGRPVKQRHVEHLNFIIQIEDERFQLPVMMSFSRGSWIHGSTFLSSLQMRSAPKMYSTRWVARVTVDRNQMGTWHALEISNPPSNPWVSEANFEVLKKRAQMLKGVTIATEEVLAQEVETGGAEVPF